MNPILLVEFCRNAPGSYCRYCVDAACRVECCFCREELLEACLCCVALECCREAGSLILPCRMLGCTGSSHWKMPCNSAWDEPCSCNISWRRINSVCRNILELLDCMWKHCRIHCIQGNLVVLVGRMIVCGNTTVLEED